MCSSEFFAAEKIWWLGLSTEKVKSIFARRLVIHFLLPVVVDILLYLDAFHLTWVFYQIMTLLHFFDWRTIFLAFCSRHCFIGLFCHQDDVIGTVASNARISGKFATASILIKLFDLLGRHTCILEGAMVIPRQRVWLLMVLRYIGNSTTWLLSELNALSQFGRHVNTLSEFVSL